MNRGGDMSRLTLCCVWIFLGFFTIRYVIKNITEIQKDLDKPNPILKKIEIENNKGSQ